MWYKHLEIYNTNKTLTEIVFFAITAEFAMDLREYNLHILFEVRGSYMNICIVALQFFWCNLHFGFLFLLGICNHFKFCIFQKNTSHNFIPSPLCCSSGHPRFRILKLYDEGSFYVPFQPQVLLFPGAFWNIISYIGSILFQHFSL